MSAPAPIHAKSDVNRIEPHAAQPIPSVPLTVPMNPAVIPLCLMLEILRRIKNAVIATFIPKRTAVVITNEADNIVKFVEIVPRRLTGKVILSENDPLEKSTSATSPILGSHIIKTKDVKPVKIPIATYKGF